MTEAALKELLGDLTTLTDKPNKESVSLTFRVATDVKDRFDRLQLRTGKHFGKKAQEMLVKLIELAEARAS